MLHILSALCASQKPVSVYTDTENMNKFAFGYILAADETAVAMHLISPDGEDDGIRVFAADDVIRVETDGQYAEKLEKLCCGRSLVQYDIPFAEGGILPFARERTGLHKIPHSEVETIDRRQEIWYS